jgi:hypothetical protein
MKREMICDEEFNITHHFQEGASYLWAGVCADDELALLSE